MVALVAVGFGFLFALVVLVALPLLLAGLVVRLVLGLLLLPFRALGLLCGAAGALVGGLAAGLAGLALLLAGLAAGAIVVLALPLGVLFLLALVAFAFVRLVARAATA
jgi:hypothetical protein